MSPLFSEELEPYRQLEIKEGVVFLKKLHIGKEAPDYFRGAMDMLKAIINLPAKLAVEESEDQAKQAEVLKIKALDLFESKMVRSYLEE